MELLCLNPTVRSVLGSQGCQEANSEGWQCMLAGTVPGNSDKEKLTKVYGYMTLNTNLRYVKIN